MNESQKKPWPYGTAGWVFVVIAVIWMVTAVVAADIRWSFSMGMLFLCLGILCLGISRRGGNNP